MTCCVMTSEINNLELKFVFSPDVLLCGWLLGLKAPTNKLTNPNLASASPRKQQQKEERETTVPR